MAVVHMDCVLNVMAESGKRSCPVCKSDYSAKDDALSGGALLRLFHVSRSTNGRLRIAALELVDCLFYPKNPPATHERIAKVKCAMVFMGLIIFAIFVLSVAGIAVLHDVGFADGAHVVSDLMLAVIVLMIALATTRCATLQIVNRRVMSDIATDWIDAGCSSAQRNGEP